MNRRLVKEIDMLMKDPGPGIAASLVEGSMNTLEAQIIGPEGSPYEDGVFMLSLTITDRYPFEPPRVRFITPVYHPNIDSDGRICLDTLKMQPQTELYRRDVNAFNSQAKKHTLEHAAKNKLGRNDIHSSSDSSKRSCENDSSSSTKRQKVENDK